MKLQFEYIAKLESDTVNDFTLIVEGQTLLQCLAKLELALIEKLSLSPYNQEQILSGDMFLADMIESFQDGNTVYNRRDFSDPEQNYTVRLIEQSV